MGPVSAAAVHLEYVEVGTGYDFEPVEVQI